MSHWNHRVVKSILPNGLAWFSVREVFYNDKGEVNGYTKDPVDISGETVEDLKETTESCGRDWGQDSRGAMREFKEGTMKYKYKKGERVWAHTKLHDLPWRMGVIISRFKSNRGFKEGKNLYSFQALPSGEGFQIAEKNIQLAEPA